MKSICCNHKVHIEGLPDFPGDEKPVTQYYICGKCGNPTDIKVNKTNTSYPELVDLITFPVKLICPNCKQMKMNLISAVYQGSENKFNLVFICDNCEERYVMNHAGKTKETKENKV